MKTGLANVCNFSQLPLSNSLFTVLFAYVVFFWFVLWLGICAEVDVDRITILAPLPLPSFFPTHNYLRVLMGVPNAQLTTIFSAKYQLTTIFLANSQLTTNFG